jgi:hypothetical protein
MQLIDIRKQVMMETFLLITGIISAYAVLLAVAVPSLLAKPGKLPAKKRTVGPTYWGVYPGYDTEDLAELKTFEVATTKGKDKVVAGSTLYANGRGIKIS